MLLEGMSCEDVCKMKLDTRLGRGKSNGVMGAMVEKVLNMGGKTGNFTYLSLAMKGRVSVWRV